jgi:chorismate mutase/prephenate dehydratase
MPREQDATRRLAEIRNEIDAVDDQLLAAISARGRLAAEVGRLKSASGSPVYAPDRESAILDRLRERNPGPFPDRVLHAVYRELMSGSFLLERPLRIAYLGPRGSFTHLAAVGKFGAAVEYEAIADIAAVFAEVERERVDFAVAPAENSTGGSVMETLGALAQSSARVCGEVQRRIQHNLLARVPIEQVERVYSKPEVFEQCKLWLLETGLIDKTVSMPSTSQAAERAASEARSAAIGSVLAGELYDLPVQRAQIQDRADNTTRFFVVGRTEAAPTGDDKSTILFTTPHRAGALVDVLNVFREAGVSLTMITSRPSGRQNWEYDFFVDAEGHASDAGLSHAIREGRSMCPVFAVLGSYPRSRDVLTDA